MASKSRTENSSVVLVLGAGASMAYGPPVMNAFMDVARRRYFQRQRTDNALTECYEELLTFHEYCRGSSWAFKRNWDNMEELYTQADLLRLSAPASEADAARERCQRIAWTIWDVYRACDPKSFQFAEICGKVIETGYHPVVITTNYDLLCELSLKARNKSVSYPGFSSEAICSGDAKCHAQLGDSEASGAEPPNSVPVIKLHGSANWFSLRGEWYAFDDCAYLSGDIHFPDLPRRLKTVADRPGNSPPSADSNGAVAEVEPAIIPPMLGKSSANRVIASQWNRAIEELSRARQIWVVGYSFPTTDMFMTRLLTQGVQNNFDLDGFYIVDTAPWDTWKPRLDEMVGTMLRKRTWFINLRAAQVFGTMFGNRADQWFLHISRVHERLAQSPPFQLE